MLIEYACARWGIEYTSGHVGGILRRGDWRRTRERFYRQEYLTQRNRRSPVLRPVSCVELVKLHGSINLFLDQDGSFVESDIWTQNPPDGYRRVIAPPGDPKYKEVANYQNASFAEFHRAIEDAGVFIVVGYGFNDEHIHGRIVEAAKRKQTPVIILTRDPADRLDAVADGGDDIWVLTGNRTTEDGTDESATRIVNRTLGVPCVLPGLRLWASDVFSMQVLGGV